MNQDKIIIDIIKEDNDLTIDNIKNKLETKKIFLSNSTIRRRLINNY